MTTTPKRPKGRMTAAEHEAWLKETGQYAAMEERRRTKEEERLRREVEFRRAEAPLVDELRAAGFEVQSAWDLVNTPSSYPLAVPILLKHLPRSYPAAVREGIARSLAVRETKALGWNLLTRLYIDEPEDRARSGLAAAIAANADDEVIGDVIALARDVRQGSSRMLLVSALETSADPRARVALTDLGTDPHLTKEIKVILGRLKRRRPAPR